MFLPGNCFLWRHNNYNVFAPFGNSLSLHVDSLLQPKGAHIYNKLVEFIKEGYWKRGFQEVVSPNIYNSKLWKTSGHWDHYSDNMFKIDIEKEMYGLKPMNCPGTHFNFIILTI